LPPRYHQNITGPILLHLNPQTCPHIPRRRTPMKWSHTRIVTPGEHSTPTSPYFAITKMRTRSARAKWTLMGIWGRVLQHFLSRVNTKSVTWHRAQHILQVETRGSGIIIICHEYIRLNDVTKSPPPPPDAPIPGIETRAASQHAHSYMGASSADVNGAGSYPSAPGNNRVS